MLRENLVGKSRDCSDGMSDDKLKSVDDLMDFVAENANPPINRKKYLDGNFTLLKLLSTVQEVFGLVILAVENMSKFDAEQMKEVHDKCNVKKLFMYHLLGSEMFSMGS